MISMLNTAIPDNRL